MGDRSPHRAGLVEQSTGEGVDLRAAVARGFSAQLKLLSTHLDRVDQRLAQQPCAPS